MARKAMCVAFIGLVALWGALAQGGLLISGNVGVGTETPSRKLDVVGGEIRASTSSGRAVQGFQTAPLGSTYGVYGENASMSGAGVWGCAMRSSSGTASGVYGLSHSTAGRGVYGYADATSGTTYGLYGQSDSEEGCAVYGYASAWTGNTKGVYGKSESVSGYGVYGEGCRDGSGVYGTGDLSGVRGRAVWVSGIGVCGESEGTEGRGVYGHASASSGTTYGVYGRVTSEDGYGGYFEGGKGVHVVGDLSCSGVKPFVEEHPGDPTKEIVYVALEGPEAGTYVRGTAELRDGEARVELPDHFGLVTGAEGVTVTLTPLGGWLELYVVEQTADHVVVREASGKSGRFNYLVQGIRKGYEDHQVVRPRTAHGEAEPVELSHRTEGP
jgi:hypothetical protein